MAYTVEELKDKYEKETLDFHKITEWHNAGFKGKGAKILNLEAYYNHGKMTYDMIKLVAPEAKIYWCDYRLRSSGDEVTHFDGTIGNNLDDEIIEFDYEIFKEFIKDIDIVTFSKGSKFANELEDLLLENCICFTSAGNEGSDGLSGAFRGRAIDVGAIYLRGSYVKKESYSSINCDFATLHGFNEGTSFSSPTLAGMAGLIVGKCGKLSYNEMFEILKDKRVTKDYGEVGYDEKFGFGVPFMPELSEIDNIIKDYIESTSPKQPEPKPEPEPIKDNDKVVNEDMKMYLVRYAHLDDVRVKAGDHLKPAIAWGGKISEATIIGTQGNTGLSTGEHLHIDVVEMPFDTNYVYKKYTMSDLHNGNPKPNQKQLELFVDKTLFESDFKITTVFNSNEYYQQFKRYHPAIDVVSLGKKEIYWNRSFAGRVIATGYDNAYGNYVVAAYLTLDFNSYKDDELITQEPEQPIKIDGQNDLSKTWLNSVGNWMYNMSNKSDVKSTWGQTSDFNGKVRYIEMHPNNLGIVTAKATTDEIGYAGINATFFGITKEGWYYPTSILKLKNAIIQGNANHLPYPQGTFCYYQDGTFGIEQLKSVNELSKPVWYAIGGIEYVRDSMVTYNATAEGFVGIYSDVHRRTTHVSIGLTKEGKILLTRHWDSTRAECAIHMKEMGCIYAIGLDGGGSAQYITPDEKRASTRNVANHLIATDLKV